MITNPVVLIASAMSVNTTAVPGQSSEDLTSFSASDKALIGMLFGLAALISLLTGRQTGKWTLAKSQTVRTI